jgi:nucleotidyltransferase/DNA polymerase involved in DNA repair
MGFGEGLDDRPVNAQRETKSISNETTFDRDIDDKAGSRESLSRIASASQRAFVTGVSQRAA